jgi:anaphase-promoting complex subunit 8
MGHEYMEMKNAGAAIEAYRHAVDINQLDYRAWYGLGQTYEMLRLPFYALHYYRKTTVLRPYDPRMWRAMASCYEALHRTEDAIKCYERAVCHADRLGRLLVCRVRAWRLCVCGCEGGGLVTACAAGRGIL